MRATTTNHNPSDKNLHTPPPSYLMLCSVTVQGSLSPVSDDGPGSQLVERLDKREAEWYMCK